MDPNQSRSPFRFAEAAPRLGARVFIDPRAHVSGAVELGDDVSVWPMAVLRGDVNRISVGARSNVQDNSVLHVTHESAWQPAGLPLVIGEDVTIGHAAILHACRVGDRCLVGMGAIVMDRAVVEPSVVVGAASLVPPGKRLVSGYLYTGTPARQARELTDKEREYFVYSAAYYVRLAQRHRAGLGGG